MTHSYHYPFGLFLQRTIKPTYLYLKYLLLLFILSSSCANARCGWKHAVVIDEMYRNKKTYEYQS